MKFVCFWRHLILKVEGESSYRIAADDSQQACTLSLGGSGGFCLFNVGLGVHKGVAVYIWPLFSSLCWETSSRLF